VSTGQYVTGSARTRRSLANRPPAPFGRLSASRPGELMRPGWADALATSRSVLLHRHMLALDQRLEHAARPSR
jgi:hypothetical protein